MTFVTSWWTKQTNSSWTTTKTRWSSVISGAVMSSYMYCVMFSERGLGGRRWRQWCGWWRSVRVRLQLGGLRRHVRWRHRPGCCAGSHQQCQPAGACPLLQTSHSIIFIVFIAMFCFRRTWRNTCRTCRNNPVTSCFISTITRQTFQRWNRLAFPADTCYFLIYLIHFTNQKTTIVFPVLESEMKWTVLLSI